MSLTDLLGQLLPVAEDLQLVEAKIFHTFRSLISKGSFKLHRCEEDDLDSLNYSQMLRELFSKNLSFSILTDPKVCEVSFSGSMQVLCLYTLSLPAEFPVCQYEEIINTVIQNPSSPSLLLLTSSMLKYGDLFYYGVKIMKRLIESQSISSQQAFYFIRNLNMAKEDLDSFCLSDTFDWKKRAAAWTECWLSFLQVISPSDNMKQILLCLDEKVIPWMGRTSAPLLIDFLSNGFSSGGMVGWLSLGGLFQLIQKHRLDYPKFFEHLLQLLTPELMHSRYRRRCLRLLNTFMRSTHLDDDMRAAILKRVILLSLSAPPSAAHWIVPFCYNQLKQHSNLLRLVHCESNQSEALYSLSCLFSHYYGPLARQAEALLKEKMTRPPFSLDKYLKEADSMSIPALLSAELEHKWSRPPPLNPSIPKQILLE